MEISDPRILDFFSRNPQLDANGWIFSMIDTYEYILKGLTDKNADNLMKHILSISSAVEKHNTESVTKLELLKGDMQCRLLEYKMSFQSGLDEVKGLVLRSQIDASSKILNDLLKMTKETLENNNTKHQQDVCNEIRYMISSLKSDHFMNIVSSSEARITRTK